METTIWIDRIARLMNRLATWRVAVPAAIVFLPFAAVFFAGSATFSIPHVEEACGAAPLDVRFYSSGSDVDRFMEGCGEAGRVAYRNLQIADFFYPVVFGLFLASVLAIALGRLFPDRPAFVGLAALAVIGTGFDYLENVFAWRAIAAFPASANTNALLGLASAAKTASFWLAGIVLIAALIALAVRTIRRRIAPMRTLSAATTVS